MIFECGISESRRKAARPAGWSLPNAEAGEDVVEDVGRVRPAGDAAEGIESAAPGDGGQLPAARLHLRCGLRNRLHCSREQGGVASIDGDLRILRSPRQDGVRDAPEQFVEPRASLCGERNGMEDF